MLQTIDITERDDFYETNKILGKYPSKVKVYGYFAAVQAGEYLLYKKAPEYVSKPVLWGVILTEAYYVLHNQSLGVGFSF